MTALKMPIKKVLFYHLNDAISIGNDDSGTRIENTIGV